MHNFIRLVVLTTLLISSARAGVSTASEDEKLQVLEGDVAIVLCFPANSLMMLIPTEGLVLTRGSAGVGSNSPRYFYLADKKQGLIISGWFENQNKFSSVKKIWKTDTKQWSKQELPDPINILFKKINGWDTVVYDMPVPVGHNTHIRAHWVQAGTWIDLHLSVTSERPIGECREQLIALLKTIEVKER